MTVPASSPSHDRNLLFALLALQLDFVTPDQVLAAATAWVRDKGKTLSQLLADQAALPGEHRGALWTLVKLHLARHGDDAARGLAGLRPLGPIRPRLEQITDPDFRASLRHVPACASAAGTLSGPAADGDGTASTVSYHPAAGGGLRYRALRPHARGGLGQVHVALDEELHREVALKEIQARFADDPQSRARFVLEAEVTGGLEHPGIVPVYGLGVYPDGRPYYAMRFIQGDNLKEASDRFHAADRDRPGQTEGQRTLALRQLLTRFVAVCNAVAYAHSRGVLHRDLKPANVMLGRFGETLVVDWGLAKFLDRPEAAVGAPPPLQPGPGGAAPTMMGSTVGTPAFMSPEQAAGRLDLLGPAADVYSLGATLYYLLTGQPPVTGADSAEVIRKVQRGDLDHPLRVRPRTPPALAAVCLKALAFQPAARYGSALDLAADVEHWLADEPVGAWPEPRRVRAWRWVRRHRPLVSGLAAAVTVAAVVLAGATVLLSAANERERAALANEIAAHDQEVLARAAAEASAREAKLQRDAARAAEERERAAKVQEQESRRLAEQKEREATEQRDLAHKYFTQAQDAVDRMLTRVSEDRDLLALEPRMELVRHKLLQDALEYYQGFLKEKSTDPQLRRATANAQMRLGLLQEELGRAGEAEASMAAALVVRQGLADEFPQDHRYRKELATTHNNLGAFLVKTGKFAKAEPHLRAALALRLHGVKDRPKDPDYRGDLANAHHNLGSLFQHLGKTDLAEGEFTEAVALLKQLADDFPTVIDYRSSLAVSYNNLGMVLGNTNRLVEAEDMARKGLQLQQHLADHFPRDPDFRGNLAGGYNNLGVLLERAQRFEEAEYAYRAAANHMRQLTDAFPNVPEHRKRLALSQVNLGTVLETLKYPREAEAAYRDALDLFQKLLNAAPTNRDYAQKLGTTCHALGCLLWAQQRPREAEEVHRRALAVRKLLADTQPDELRHQEDCGTTQLWLAHLAADARDWPRVRVLAPPALATLENARRLAPADAEVRHLLARARLLLAEAHLTPADYPQAGQMLADLAALPPASANLHFRATLLAARGLALAEKDATLGDPRRKELLDAFRARALTFLDGAVQRGFADAARLKAEADLEPLRGLPAFQALARKVEGQ